MVDVGEMGDEDAPPVDALELVEARAADIEVEGVDDQADPRVAERVEHGERVG